MRIFAPFILSLFIVTAGAAQGNVSPDALKTTEAATGKPLVATISIPGSWATWPLANISTKVSTDKAVVLDGVKVQTRVRTFSAPQMVSAEICGYADAGADDGKTGYPFFDADGIYRVDDFTTYERNGRVFAYEVIYNVYRDGQEIGAGLGGIYVDEEGRGEFRINCNLNDQHRTPVPKWIKELAASKSRTK